MNITRKHILWIMFGLLSIGSAIFTIKYFGRAVPIVNLDLRMDRKQALEQAANIARQFNLGPSDYQQAALFNTDQTTKIYVELEAGGAQTFNDMVTGNLYSPYTWQVRHFRPFETNELRVIFKADGTPYGFIETIPDNVSGSALTLSEAEKIARHLASQHWNVNFDDFARVETSKSTKPNGRVDHTFVYERPIKINKATYRLSIVVSGNKVTQLIHFVKVPQEFIHRFTQLRSSNRTLRHVADILRFLLYILGIGCFGFIILFRRRYLLWKTPIIVGLVIALLNSLEQLSSFPHDFYFYQTTTPIHTFILDFMITVANNFFYAFILFTFIFMIAESLSRLAFGHQPLLWTIWSKSSGSSWQTLGRTIASYLLIPISFADIVLFYMLTTRYLGWWTPAEQHMDPNILAAYVPWINAIAPSIQAGFFEECLFRAFPLATAALLGKRFGKKNWFLAAGFVIQIFIFGASHADYPGFPAYSRLVELIFFSTLIGYVYIKFGLLIGIISHAAYDLILYSLPLFVSTAPNAWVNQLPVIVIGLLPIIIVMIRRLQYGSWHELDNTGYNSAWKPSSIEQKNTTYFEQECMVQPGAKRLIILGSAAIVGIICWLVLSKFSTDAPPLRMTRSRAINLATQTLHDRGYKLDNSWIPIARVEGFNIPALNSGYTTGAPEIVDQHRFIWQKGGKQLYKTFLSSYLDPAYWKVHFIKISGNLEERAEEYDVYITHNERILRITHKIPEARQGTMLAEQEARNIAQQVLKNMYNLDASSLKEISAESSKQPHRLDWIFTFADISTYPLKDGQARTVIGIDGNQQADYYQYIYVPQEWSRTQETNRSIFDVINQIADNLIKLLWIIACIFILMTGISLPMRYALISTLVVSILYIIQIINNWPVTISYFLNAQEPYVHQIFRISSSIFISLLSAIAISVISMIVASKGIRSLEDKKKEISIGIALGFAWLGLLAIIKYYAPSIQPLWGNYNNLDSLSPVISAVIRSIFQLIREATFIMLIVQLVNRIRNFSYAILVKVIVLAASAFFVIASQPILTITHLVFNGMLAALFFIASYFIAFRHWPTSIAWFSTTIICILLWQQAAFNIIPHAYLTAACVTIVLGILTWTWNKTIVKVIPKD